VTGGAHDPATGEIVVNTAGGPISIDIGRLGDSTGMTQLSAAFSPANASRNGSPVGNLTGLEFDEKGFLHATYDTGFTRTLYQIPLVDVPSVNGLIAMDNQTYKVSPDSGPFTCGMRAMVRPARSSAMPVKPPTPTSQPN
jgi:flagellar hook protein FlgE